MPGPTQAHVCWWDVLWSDECIPNVFLPKTRDCNLSRPWSSVFVMCVCEKLEEWMVDKRGFYLLWFYFRAWLKMSNEKVYEKYILQVFIVLKKF